MLRQRRELSLETSDFLPSTGRGGSALRGAADSPGGAPIFYALPADAAEPGITVPLYEYLSDGDAPAIYDVRGDLEITGYRRCPDPLCRVWPSPFRTGTLAE
jgi:hypothetical protein